ncbi:hypothetical protein, partial [Saccharothrix sp. Mg75]|uniref:hypothetical protein n=1 Tax=Saccharothrix sp. Mg75 TaxID=3445357 RepID=UPI003EEDC8E8
MSAEIFITYTEGTDVQAAFRSAVEQAQYDHGHAGGTGTIAEKDDYIVIDDTPQPERDAEALARTLIENRDSRIDNPWGPAGALAVRDGLRTLTGLPVPTRADGYPDERTTALTAIEGCLADGRSGCGP